MPNTVTPLQIGQITVSMREFTLSHGDKNLELQPKYIEVLTFLAAHPGELISRKEIIEHVWQGNNFVGEKALTNAIWHLRKAFKQLDPDNEYIETKRKSGYRLLIATEQPLPEIYTRDDSQTPAYYTHRTIGLMLALLLFFCVFVIYEYIQINTPSEQSWQEQLITQSPGRELFASISKNEKSLAFTWRKLNGQTDLYIRDLSRADAKLINITNNDHVESRSVWHPDSNQLYFVSKSTQSCGIKAHNRATRDLRTLLECEPNQSIDLAISPLGDTLFVTYPNAENNLQIAEFSLITEQFVRFLPCPTQCVQGSVESIALAPNAQQLAITRNLENGNEVLFIYDLNTLQETPVLFGKSDLRGIDWHPNAAKLVYTAIEFGRRTGYELDLNSLQSKQLPVRGMSYPVYGQSGDIYFHQWQISTSIMRLELDSSVAATPFPLLTGSDNYRYPDYSSVTNKLALVSNKSGFDEIWITIPETDSLQQLTTLQGEVSHPVWSPDGQKIAFTCNLNGSSAVYIYDFDTQTTRLVSQQLPFNQKPRWALDSQSLLLPHNNVIYRLTLASAQLEELFEGAHAIPVSESSYIVYQDNQGLSKYSYTPEGDLAVEDITDFPLSSSTGWQLTSKGIYYFNVKGADYRLSFYDFATKQSQDIIRTPERSFSRFRGMTYIPERNWLLFTGYEAPDVNIKRLSKL
ncbi:winged helix-turn-helix domain-containing protein [Pseudoalteromonas fenneropenaei]|uniref:Winged helix-turn-helix domain-containing protein n=1 Tax=Pseudoalteromonas fenneropenaei TaxID=1737459 RepID=A0ABV7CQA4_9GAMM